MMYWRSIATPIIKNVLEQHPEEGAAQRQALHDAYPFGQRAYHPYEVWLGEIKRQKRNLPKMPKNMPLCGQVDLFAEVGE